MIKLTPSQLTLMKTIISEGYIVKQESSGTDQINLPILNALGYVVPSPSHAQQERGEIFVPTGNGQKAIRKAEAALLETPDDLIKVIEITMPNGDKCIVDEWRDVADAIAETYYGEDWIGYSELGEQLTLTIMQMTRREFDALEQYEPG